MSTPALPPHVPSTEATGFDADADVNALKATPKEDYGTADDPEPEPAPKAEPTADGPTPEGDAGGEGGAGDGPTSRNATASAREFLEVYDTLQSYGFSFYSQGMPAEKFQLPQFAKDRAVHHLAKGLEKMGTPELPWWVGLLIALAPPAGINFMAAREHRRATEAQAQQEARRQRSNMHVVHPTTIIHPDGTESKAPPPPPPAPRQAYQRKQGQPCIVCGTTCRPGKKYCSKSCSGKGAAMQRQAQATPTTTEAPAA